MGKRSWLDLRLHPTEVAQKVRRNCPGTYLGYWLDEACDLIDSALTTARADPVG